MDRPVRRRARTRLFAAFVLACMLIGGTGCSSGSGSRWLAWDFFEQRPEGPRLMLTYMDKAGRMVILAKDLDIPAQVQERDALPYSENASGAVWVGTRFPYEKAIKLIGWSRHYYTGLRYVALSDYTFPGIDRFDQDLYIGGATETAVTRLNLRAWEESDWTALARAASREEFDQVIRSRYTAP